MAGTSKEAEEKVNDTLQAQAQRLEIQKVGEKLLFEKLEQSENHKVVFDWSPDFYKGVVGLLATKACQKYGVASFVGSVIEDKIVGSARAPDDVNLLEAFEFAKDHLVKFGGPAQRDAEPVEGVEFKAVPMKKAVLFDHF